MAGITVDVTFSTPLSATAPDPTLILPSVGSAAVPAIWMLRVPVEACVKPVAAVNVLFGPTVRMPLLVNEPTAEKLRAPARITWGVLSGCVEELHVACYHFMGCEIRENFDSPPGDNG